MDELLKNFCIHIDDNISKDLANEIRRYISGLGNIGIDSGEDYDVIEHDVKQIMSTYFKKNGFGNIAENLYNGYVVNDDKCLISAVKIFVSFYSKFQMVRLRCLFMRWRINAENYYSDEEDNINNDSYIDNKNYGKYRSDNTGGVMNMPVSLNSRDCSSRSPNRSIDRDRGVGMQIQGNSDKLDVFNKLYINSYKKNDEKLLNNEVKRLSEMDECTFRPNTKRK